MVIAREVLHVCLQDSTDTWEKAEASLGKKLNSTRIRIGKTYDDLYAATKIANLRLTQSLTLVD